jgi:hypothetical protein
MAPVAEHLVGRAAEVRVLDGAVEALEGGGRASSS